MNNIFYRYIRPVKFDEKRLEFQTQPKGGVCLRFEFYPETSTLWFTHARCNGTELFSKEVAKRIADARAFNSKAEGTEAIHGPILYDKNPLVLCERVADFCADWTLPEKHTVSFQYLRQEFRELGTVLENILVLNAQERIKAEIWKSSISATNTKTQYRTLYEHDH